MATPVFLCAAAQDEAYRNELYVHLRPRESKGRLRIWHAGLTDPGAHAATMRTAQLEQAQIVILLVSSDLLNAHQDEITAALQRKMRAHHKRGHPG